MSTDSQKTQDVARFFSHARRIPLLVGKMPDGTKIYGGPYTIYQIVGLLGTLALAYTTHDLWTTDAIIADLLLAVVLSLGVGLLAGFIPTNTRNPAVAVYTFGTAVKAPRNGECRGRVLKLKKPHQPRIRLSAQPTFLIDEAEDHSPVEVEFDTASAAEESVSSAPEVEEEVAEETPPVSELPRTGLERLIAQSKKAS